LLYTPFVNIHFCRDLADAPLLQVFEHKADAFNFAQAGECLGKMALKFVVLQGLLRIVLEILDITFERFKDTRPGFAQQIQRGVDCDAVYPRVQPGRAPELVALVPGVEQCILHGIGGQIGVPRDLQAC